MSFLGNGFLNESKPFQLIRQSPRSYAIPNSLIYANMRRNEMDTSQSRLAILPEDLLLNTPLESL